MCIAEKLRREKEFMKTESTASVRQKNNKMSWGERGQTQTLNYLSIIYCSSNRAYSLVSFSQLCARYETPFRSSFQNGGRKFSRFHNVVSGVQLIVFTSLRLVANSSFVFYLAPTLNSFTVWVSFSQSGLVGDLQPIRFFF